MPNPGTENQSTVIVNIQGNSDGLNQTIQQAQQGLQGLSQTKVTNSSIASLKQQLREATNEALRLQQAGEENTQAYREAVRTIAELRDQQDVLNRTVSAFDPGNKLNAFVGIAKSAATAVQGYTGALSFLGVESENAEQALLKLQGIMAFTDALNGIGDLQDFWKGFVANIQASIAPMNASSIAAKGLRLALKGIGIGLIITAITYLIANWNDLKDTFSDIIPGVGNLGGMFDKLKAILMGVGNAVLQYIITPLRAAVHIIKGEFKEALNDVKKGYDVVNNFQEGYNKTRLNQAKEAERKIAEEKVKNLEYTLKMTRQNSKEALAVENQLADARIKAAKNDEERLKATQDRNVMYRQREFKAQEESERKAEAARQQSIARAKAAAEKEAQERKQALEDIGRNNDEANKVLSQHNMTAREKELADLEADYVKKVALAEKYNQSTGKITEAYNLKRQEVNAKYDDAITEALAERENRNLGFYKGKEIELNAFYDNLLKNATEKEKQIIEQRRKSELAALDVEKELGNSNVKAQINLTTVTSENTIDEREDTPETIAAKTAAILTAQLDAENAAFELKKEQLQGQNEELQILEAEHNARLVDIETQGVNAVKALDDAQYGYKVATLNKVGDAVTSLGELIGENTVAGKALAIAQATINTFLGATEVLKNPTTIPEPYGTIAKIASMVTVIGTGLATVKKIASVKIDGKGGGGSASSISAPSIADATAPVVNAANLNQSSLPQDVRVVNPENQVVRAYITDKDLKDNEDRTNFYNNLSTL